MKTILILLENIYEDLELWYPKIRLEEEGYKTIVAAPQAKTTYLGKHGYPCVSDIDFNQMEKGEFDALVIPGGFSPDKLRRYNPVLSIVQKLNSQQKPIAFICHGGWVAISANILSGKKATSTIAIRDDMVNAGCLWEDKSVVVDGNLISSRTPKDLPDFCKALLSAL